MMNPIDPIMRNPRAHCLAIVMNSKERYFFYLFRLTFLVGFFAIHDEVLGGVVKLSQLSNYSLLFSFAGHFYMYKIKLILI